ncbi:hypothetical protein T492DRAFT_95351 [Pavlovales sp. CCMP2436]|nr:hypothetical protein T492DRAFT_95351 [Pavlovales sp. CCMP2436]
MVELWLSFCLALRLGRDLRYRVLSKIRNLFFRVNHTSTIIALRETNPLYTDWVTELFSYYLSNGRQVGGRGEMRHVKGSGEKGEWGERGAGRKGSGGKGRSSYGVPDVSYIGDVTFVVPRVERREGGDWRRSS